jgi:hypothetical protein
MNNLGGHEATFSTKGAGISVLPIQLFTSQFVDLTVSIASSLSEAPEFTAVVTETRCPQARYIVSTGEVILA